MLVVTTEVQLPCLSSVFMIIKYTGVRIPSMPYSSDDSLISTSCSSIDSQATTSDRIPSMPYSSEDSLVSTSCSSIDSQASTSDTDISHEDMVTNGSENAYSSDDDNYHDTSDLKDNNNNNQSTNSNQHSSGNVNYNSSSESCDVRTTTEMPPVALTDLTNIQMEVTIRLMEGERRHLMMLTRQLVLCLAEQRVSKFQVDVLKDNIRRIHLKYLSLDKEYRVACKEALIRRMHMLNKPSRSQPSIGVKQTNKPRPSIFGTVAQTRSPQTRRQKRESVDPQMLSLSQMFGSGTGYVGTDNNNHTEPHRNTEALIFQNGNLHSGSLEALIQHLIPTADYYPDRTYIFAFLLSSRLFIRPHELLAEVCKIGAMEEDLKHSNLDNADKLRASQLGPRVVSLLSEWTDMFPYDFRDDRMMKQLRDITQRIIATQPDLRKDISNLSYNLVTKLTNLKSYEENLAKIEAVEQQKAQTQDVAATDIMEVCPSPLVLAQQLTHVELERLSMIGPEEFVQAFCKERVAPDGVSYQDTKTTHNLESYVQWFNRLSYLVASEITSHLKKKNRVKVVEYFIDVAKECINIGNFNSLMAVIAGMNLSPVTRLKKMWSKVNRDKLKILEHQMNPSNNFGSYRSCLKAAMWRSEGAADDREKIVIPFFSLFVKDLYFLNEGCSSKQEDGSINFHKCWQTAKQISDLLAWQQVECPFDKCPSIINYLLTTPIYNESMLSMASYECETPETSYDKEKYKQLKSQTSLTSL